MINILLPIAGLAKRFADCGYSLPKPLISVSGTPMIKLALHSLVPPAEHQQVRLIFVVREDHCANHDIANALRNIFPGWEAVFATVNHITQGTLCSCLIARDLIQPDEPLIIYTPDVCFESDFTPQQFADSGLDGMLLTFKANSPDHSYVTVDEAGIATRTAEKVVISGDAMVGVYCFRTGQMFLDCADEAIANNLRVNNEFYVAPIFNLLIRDNQKIGIHRTRKMYVLGTPEDLQFYETNVARYAPINRFALCCDHSGFALKMLLSQTLQDLGIEFVDFGTYSVKDSDHYEALKPCIEYLKDTSHTIGVAACSTGQGFNIAANKAKGIRSALVRDAHAAEMARRHNAANFFCLPATVNVEELPEIVRAIVRNSFDGGRHMTRIRKVATDGLFSA